MRGITEERLRRLLSIVQDEIYRLHIRDLIATECTELNPWHPIDTAPEGRKIRLFVNFSGVKEGYQTEGYISPLNRYLYTHFCELPEDPK